VKKEGKERGGSEGQHAQTHIIGGGRGGGGRTAGGGLTSGVGGREGKAGRGLYRVSIRFLGLLRGFLVHLGVEKATRHVFVHLSRGTVRHHQDLTMDWRGG
jgi:hypothetical protein